MQVVQPHPPFPCPGLDAAVKDLASFLEETDTLRGELETAKAAAAAAEKVSDFGLLVSLPTPHSIPGCSSVSSSQDTTFPSCSALSL